MKTTPIIGTLLYALALAACNNASQPRDQATDSASTATVASSQKIQDQSSATLPEAVPVPPASSSPIVNGQAPEPAMATETPVAVASADAPTTTGSSTPETSSSVAATSDTSSSAQAPAEGPAPRSNQEQAKGGTDSAATEPLGALNADEQSKSMPMALHGNNHSSPSVDQRATN
jgi:hypothetical protein